MGRIPCWAFWGTVALGIAVVAAYAGGVHPITQRAPAITVEPIARVARPDDVRSPDRILATLYATISGSAGQHRDWDRLRSLFVPGGRFFVVGHGSGNAVQTESFSVEEYIARAMPVMEREGFWEREIARHTESYDHIAQVFSTYESRHQPGDKPFERGINSIQLLNDGHRWWLVSVFWEPEIPGHPIPKKYLH